MSLVDTLVQPMRTAYDKAVDKNEMRASEYGAMRVAQRQTDGPSSIATSQIKDAVARSAGKTIQVPVLNAENVTLGNTRSCVVVDSENTSALIGITFVTLSFGFTMTPSQHGNNDISYQQDFEHKLRKYLLKAADTIDQMVVDQLNADKNAVWTGEITNTYAQVSNALQVPKSEQFDFYNQLSGIMKVMDFYSTPYDIIANMMHEPLVRRHRNQGASNDENDAFQFNLGYNYNFTNNVVNRSGVHSTLYAIPQGTVAMMNRNMPDNIAGHSTGDKEWGLTRLPILDQTWGTFYTRDCSDRSALHAGTGHLTQTLLEGFEFATDIALITAYNSDPVTRYNPIVKAEMWATDSAPV